MGFQEQMTETLNRLPDVRQTVLFSATLPRLLVDFAKAGLKDPTLIRLNTDSKLPDTLKTVFWVMRDEDKYPAVIHLVRTLLENKQLTVVFVPTKHHVEYLKEVRYVHARYISFKKSLMKWPVLPSLKQDSKTILNVMRGFSIISDFRESRYTV